MLRLQFFLLVALVASALGLVTSQHQARNLFVELERAQGDARQLEIEWNQLQVEASAASTHGLIDQVARRELRMIPVTPARTLYIDLAGAGPQPGGTANGSAR